MYKLIGLVFCIFMGITAISLGAGAAYPPINNVAQPVVCSGGQLSAQQSITTPLPDRTYIQAEYVCVDPTGTIEPLNKFWIALVSGTFYGIILFGVFWGIIAIKKGKS